MKIRIALKHHLPVRIVLGQHIGTGADRVPVERQVFLRHAGLTIKTIDLHRHRREKRHRQPVLKLRIAALQPDPISVVIDDLDAGQWILPEIEPGVAFAAFDQGLVGLFQGIRIFLEPDDVIGHQAEDRRMQTRMREPFDLVFEILRFELARAVFSEVGEHIARGDFGFGQRVIAVGAGGVARERGVRLIHDAVFDADFVDGVSHRARRRGSGQAVPVRVEEIRLRHGCGDARNQRIGTLEVVILQRRLVNLRGKNDFIRAVRLHRIKVLGPLGERRVENILPGLRRRIRVVPVGDAAAGQHQQRHSQARREQSRRHMRIHRQPV